MLLHLTGGDAVPNGGLVSAALCVIIAWFTGYIVRQRRRYALRLQDEAASKAVAEERLRIARELHDVVAHSMSVIAVQAGYGQYVIDTQPADARNALGAIQATSREALDEMRRMLGALRQADETDQREVAARADGRHRCRGRCRLAPARWRVTSASRRRRRRGARPLLPAPGLADLDRLVSRTASAGVRVDVTRCGQPRELPASIDLSAYRIVQEALTNVVKHARTSSCRRADRLRPGRADPRGDGQRRGPARDGRSRGIPAREQPGPGAGPSRPTRRRRPRPALTLPRRHARLARCPR